MFLTTLCGYGTMTFRRTHATSEDSTAQQVWTRMRHLAVGKYGKRTLPGKIYKCTPLPPCQNPARGLYELFPDYGKRLAITGCGSVWLERCVRDAETACSNHAIPTRNPKPLTRNREGLFSLSKSHNKAAVASVDTGQGARRGGNDICTENSEQKDCNLGSRLRMRREELRMSRNVLAKKAGVALSTVQKYEEGGDPKASILGKLAKELDISTDWLISGSTHTTSPPGEECAIEPLHGHADAGVVIHTAKRDYGLVLVPKVKARLSAGNGSLETSDELEGLFAFRETWCRTKGQPGNMVLMDVGGDSMSPAIESGDTVLIDKSKTEIIAGHIYAVGIDDEVLVKYADKLPGKLVLCSENVRYASIEIDLSQEHTNIRIIGRVIWWCREAR